MHVSFLSQRVRFGKLKSAEKDLYSKKYFPKLHFQIVFYKNISHGYQTT